MVFSDVSFRDPCFVAGWSDGPGIWESRMNASFPLVAAIQAVLLASLTGETAATVVTGLAYTPITPCRIVDIRVTGVPFAAKETRTYFANGASTQGARLARSIRA